MNKKLTKLSLCILLLLVLCGSTVFLYHFIAKRNQEPVSIYVASDLHYLSPEYTGDYFKNPLPDFDGKSTHYSAQYVDAFFQEVIDKKPAFLILSGDMTLNGAKKSHEELVEKLNAVEAAGIEVLVIPGNHDVDSGAGNYAVEVPVYVENVDHTAFMEKYQDFGFNQALSRDRDSFSYIYEVTPYLRILMLDVNSGTKGFVDKDTLIWIEEELKAAKFAGADVIAVSHQNLHIHNELLYFSYQIYNPEELLALYEKYDVRLNLSGHIHVQSIVSDSSVPEIAISALATAGSQYGELVYDGKSLDYSTHKTDVSAYAESIGTTDENLLSFNEYSVFYFEEVARQQVYRRYAESDYGEDKIKIMANTFAMINSTYFMGASLDETSLSEGISYWKAEEDNFTSRYIEVMLKEMTTDNQSLHIDLQ